MLVFCLSRECVEENRVSLYPSPAEKAAEQSNEEGSSSYDNDTVPQVRKRIRLRNLLLDVLMSHFTTEHNEFDTR